MSRGSSTVQVKTSIPLLCSAWMALCSRQAEAESGVGGLGFDCEGGGVDGRCVDERDGLCILLQSADQEELRVEE